MPAEIPRRPFGRYDETVSAMALGGYHLGTLDTEKEAARIVHEAVDAGLDFMDNAWEYNEGKSEDWMGKALVGRRDKVFLMSKVCTHGRDKKVAMRQLKQSLRRLRTDYLDLWQVHECVYWNDPDLHFMRGGVIEALDEAKRSGMVRYVGFTGHKHPDIHLRMMSHDYPFDAAQMPLNPFDGTFRSFLGHVVPECIRRGIAVIGMKALGGDGSSVKKRAVTAEEAYRYAMSLPVTTIVAGIDSMKILRQNLKIARGFTPMSSAMQRGLERGVREQASDGRFELYKTTAKHDADVGRKQHGYPTMAEVGG
jgi:uncharacterized protein